MNAQDRIFKAQEAASSLNRRIEAETDEQAKEGLSQALSEVLDELDALQAEMENTREWHNK